MLFEFKSRATGSVVMTEVVGKRMLEVIGKAADERGIITTAQLPHAIQALRTAIEAERKEIARWLAEEGGKPAEDRGESAGLEDADTVPAIRFSQRAAPLIEMFERSLAAGRDVTWGV